MVYSFCTRSTGLVLDSRYSIIIKSTKVHENETSPKGKLFLPKLYFLFVLLKHPVEEATNIENQHSQ